METLDPKRKLYVTREHQGTVSIDCIEMVDSDMECNSGIIHTLRFVSIICFSFLLKFVYSVPD
ncbi:unnamed protein product [Trichobilharzia regenti]|nr:unnamed protein product [Trichobilharzia regenti]